MRITDLNTLVTASLSDILYIVDVSDTGDFISGSSKQITVGNFFSSSNVGGGGGGGGGGGSGYLIITSSVLSSSLNLESETFTSNGIQTSYTLSSNISSSEDVFVFINGVSQIPLINYSITGSTLNLSGIASSGSKIEVRRASNDFNITFITSSMGVEYFSGNSSTTQFTLTNGQTVLHNYDVLVSIDGLIQKPTTDYSITGSTLNFTVAPPNNTDIEVRYLSPQTFTIISGSGGGGGGSGAGFPFSGSAVITGSLLVTDYISGSFTGSLLGTSSYALTSSNTISSSYALSSSNSFTSSYAFNANNSFTAVTASYALFASSSVGGATGFPFSGSAVITGSLLVSGSGIITTGSLFVSGSGSINGNLNVTQTITINDTNISASNGDLYLNGTLLRTIRYAYFSSSISSSSQVGILDVRNTLLVGKSLLSGNIYVNNLSTSSNAVINIYNSASLSLFQTETVTPSQNLILNLTDFVPLLISGSGNFLFQITSSVT